MYCENVTESFIKYLQSKEIYHVDKFPDKLNIDNINYSMVKEQIHIINEFHMKTLGYTGHMGKRLDNNIGKTVERYKVYIKRLNRDLTKIQQSNIDSDLKKRFMINGEIYLNRAQKCIDSIYKSDYISLINRSTNRLEMCIGNTYFNNLRKSNNIQISDIQGCCYNMVEMDLTYFLGRMKRKGLELDFNNLIQEFCNLESLDANSEKFILSSISYPYAFMKWCARYREKSKNWSEEEYSLNLEKAIIEDGNSLI